MWLQLYHRYQGTISKKSGRMPWIYQKMGAQIWHVRIFAHFLPDSPKEHDTYPLVRRQETKTQKRSAIDLGLCYI
ncbi:8660_t:CDS:2 [Entrophospora sp. SA101]|nr:8660_t:CDS:2 [Entrophospora sp. SA101]